MSAAADAVKAHWLRVLAGVVPHSQPPESVTITQGVIPVTVKAIIESPKRPVISDGSGGTQETLNVFVMRDPDSEYDGTAIGGIDTFKVGAKLIRNNLPYTFDGTVLDFAQHYQVVVFVRQMRFAQGRR